MKMLLELPHRRPKTVLAFFIVITFLAVVALIRPGLGMDPNPYPLNRNHPSMVAYRQLKMDYTGTLETALILLRHQETIYNSATLQRLSDLTGALEKITLMTPGDVEAFAAFKEQSGKEIGSLIASIVEGGITNDDDLALSDLDTLLADGAEAPPGFLSFLDDLRLKLYPVREVTSLANVENIITRDDALVVGKVYKAAPSDASGLRAVADQAQNNEIFRDMLISRDGRTTGILLETYIPQERSELMLALARQIAEITKSLPGEEELFLGGTPVMFAEGIQSMQNDNATLFPIVIALVVIILLLTFRSLTGVLLPVAVVLVSLIWTMAVMALLGIPFNVLTTSLPVFLITIGVADGIHLISEFQDQFRRLGDRKAAVTATLRHMRLPVIMTSLTTSVGFVALAVTDIQWIQEFGLFVALGAVLAMVVSLALIPAVQSLGKNTPGASPATFSRSPLRMLDGLASSGLQRLSGFAIGHPWWVLAGTLAVLALGIQGMTRVKVENDFITFFSEDRKVVAATKALDSYLAGSNVANIIVTMDSSAPEPFKNPENLARVEGLQRHMESQPYVGKTLGLTDMIKRINLVLHDNDPAYNRLPGVSEPAAPGAAEQVSGRHLVSQYLLLYENGGGDNLSDVTDSRYETLNIQVILSTRSTTIVKRLMAEMEDYTARHFPQGMTARMAGNAELTTTSVREITRGQIISLTLSLSVIFLLLLIEFRSLGKGLLGMIPLVIAVVVNFGAMGWLGIDLNAPLAVISSIVIGIGVDFAIHYLNRLQIELDQHGDLSAAIQATMETSGKAISANAVIVAAGFLVLLAADMVPMQNMGLIISQLLLVCAMATLLCIPAAVALTQPRFVRLALLQPALQGSAS